MKGRRVLVDLLVIFGLVAAVAGFWYLAPQQVSITLFYAPAVAGRTMAIVIDGGGFYEFTVPASESYRWCYAVGCPTALPDALLGRGHHDIRVTLNGSAVLEQGFVVGGRSYAWVIVGNDTTRFGIADSPQLFS